MHHSTALTRIFVDNIFVEIRAVEGLIAFRVVTFFLLNKKSLC